MSEDPNRWALAHKMRAKSGFPPMTDEEMLRQAGEIAKGREGGGDFGVDEYGWPIDYTSAAITLALEIPRLLARIHTLETSTTGTTP